MEIRKSFDCLSCENLLDWDCNFDDDHWFACKFDYDENEELLKCPMFRSSEGKVNK